LIGLKKTLNKKVIPDLEKLKEEVKASAKSIAYKGQNMKKTVKQLLGYLENAGAYLASEGEHRVMTDTIKAVSDFESVGDGFVKFAVDTVEQKLGQCGPVHDMYQGLKVEACENLVRPLNGLWLGLGTLALGWSLLILVGLYIKGIFSRSNYKPAYVSTTQYGIELARMQQGKSHGATAAPSAPPVGGEMMIAAHPHQQQIPINNKNMNNRRNLSARYNNDPHDVARHYLNGMESKSYK